ncbi:GNAT family N-acetyltransferase [Candidatus Dependentiae bacterium]|jgi:ribosomal-protein-alanine N-acetyltransferase|nr:GNAT family N-acetyltransferase [Candidatus Dependentiae bacterium]
MKYNAPRKTPYIVTERCILRFPRPKEYPDICDFVIKNKAHFAPWEPLQSEEYYTINYWKNKSAQSHNDFINDKSCFLNIYLKENELERLIGMINYSNFVRGALQSCSLGFKIAQSMQGKGLMTECVQAANAYIFETLNLHRIAASYMPHNSASARVLEKCNFHQEGIAPDYLHINGKWETHVRTSLINHNWKSL